MNCPKCQTLNRASANYCKNCGNLLMEVCPRCNFALPELASFCDHCGLRLVDSSGFSWWAPNEAQEVSPAKQVEPSKPTTPKTAIPLPVTSVAPPPAPPVTSTSPTPRITSPPAVDPQLQQYIPKELLQKLEAAQRSGIMAGERRVVTMLFCDLKGSTAAAEQMDPEEWTDLINGAFEPMIRPIYQYEGIVARLMGDGILAFFGAPIAHEDDPQRAILAGLDIITGLKSYQEQVQLRHGIDIAVRVGINTGLVVVGAVGSDLRMEYTALGDAINLASRMEQTAEPNTVRVAQDTYKLVRSLFEFEELGGIEVKGKNEPVLAYQVLGRRVLPGQKRGIEGLYAEIVGREEELQALRDVMTYLKQGVGKIVVLLGEAGLGKSRLVAETRVIFNELIGGDGNWYGTNSLSYETNQAYGLFQRLIRSMQGITYTDPPNIVREKLGQLSAYLPEEKRPRSLQIFEALFGIENKNGAPPLEGEAFKRELFEVTSMWWRASFANHPTVLVFDDMHWSDEASIELLLQLLPLTEEIPLVLLCALRSERDTPAWQIKTAAEDEFSYRSTELLLQPLSEADSNELVNRLLAIAELPDRLRANILEKAAGNPFFIEEVVRTLVENGAVIPEERTVNGETRRYWRATSEGADFDVPDNLQALLSARMDRLEDATRGTLQIASVIGRNFYHRVLQAVDNATQELDKRLSTLLRQEIIREAARMPEVEYTFRNPLTQEAVYKTILLKRRREFHRRVGEAIEALYPDRLDGLFGLLAHHFNLAGERDKAIQYSQQAARQASNLYAYDDAIRNLRSALALIEKGEQSEIHLDLLEELGDVYRLLRDSDQALQNYQKALEVWKNLPNADQHTNLRLNRKIVQLVDDLKWTVGLEVLQQANERRLESLHSLEAGLESILAQSPHLETVHVLIALSTDAWRIQNPPDWEAAQHYAQTAVDMARQLDDPVLLSKAFGALAMVLDGRSLLRDHLVIAYQRLEICRQPGFDDVLERLEALRGVGAALTYAGEYHQAMPYLQETEELATHAQVADQQVNALILQSLCWYRIDKWDNVLSTEEKWRGLERRYSRERVGET